MKKVIPTLLENKKKHISKISDYTGREIETAVHDLGTLQHLRHPCLRQAVNWLGYTLTLGEAGVHTLFRGRWRAARRRGVPQWTDLLQSD